MFAKIFNHADFGQILAVAKSNDEGDPCISIFFKPKNFDVCELTFGFEDSDMGYNRRDKVFNSKKLKDAAFRAVKSTIFYVLED